MPDARPRSSRPSLASVLIPEPHLPYAMRRTLAFTTVSVFILLFAYESCVAAAAVAGDGALGARLGRWMWRQGVAVDSGGQLPVGGAPASDGLAVADESQESEGAVEATDWNKYVWHRDLDWSVGSGRLILVGDVHGMVDSLKQLVAELSPTSDDTVVLIGDLVAKHPTISSSLDTVSYAREQGFRSVRGNHDQAVIAWRTWMEEHRRWLRTKSSNAPLEDQDEDEDATLEGEEWLDAEGPPLVEAGETPERLRIPKGWIWKSQHFEIARRMARRDYKWLLDLSLTLHVRNLHTYFVHAGMLPWDRPTSGRRRAISSSALFNVSSSPTTFSPISTNSQSDDGLDPLSDQSQDSSILLVEENRDPFTLLNVRGVAHGRVTKSGKRGKPWYSIWNRSMKRCARKWRAEGQDVERHVERQEEEDKVEEDEDSGEDDDDEEETGDIETQAKCRPLAIVYGHWAAKGLKVKPYSVGLDSGCVYGRAMSALVLGDDALVASTSTDEDEVSTDGRRRSTRTVSLQGQEGVIVTIPCEKP